MIFDIKKRKTTIIGGARSGMAVAETVLRLGGIAKISENKALGGDTGFPTKAFGNDMVGIGSGKGMSGNDKGRSGNGNFCMETGGHTKAFIQDSDYVVLSPGVRLDAQPVQWAKEAGIEVMGEVEFAFRLCPCPIIAVTGSNGKTTTSTVIAEILQRAGRPVRLCGNIGSPLSQYVLDLKPSDTVVLEISSFQLESTSRFKPHVAVWTNFSQNHLDRHKDLEEYFQAKCRIFANQGPGDFAILNFQQREHKDLAKRLKARVLFFNEPLDSRWSLPPNVSVGGGHDKQRSGNGKGGGHEVTGRDHEIDNPNYSAAMEAAKALGICEEVCLETFAGFRGVEHRLEFVRDVGGIDFINDSKSTTVEAGRWALERARKPMVMICGGLDKHLDYSPLKALVGKKVKHMIAIGQARDIMKSTFGDVVEVDTYTSFEEAVKAARDIAQPGESVLLSPMCASFDMFKDYEDRGRKFKEIVNKLS